ncbi:MAG: hypothetical protein IJO32_06715 [Bacilli bacterium]|nr:hypothetical protein [Bacilli bacterium]
MNKKSYIRIEIPERIEQRQLIGKITTLPKKQFLKYYKAIIDIFNTDFINKFNQSTEKQTN